MKKIILSLTFLTLSFTSTFSFSQFIRPEGSQNQEQKSLTKEQKILDNTAFLNGLWVGYGLYCKIPNETVEVMHNKFITSIVARLKNEEDKKRVLNRYDQNVKIAQTKGPEYSKGTCDHIVEEYKKMVKAFEADADILINNKVDSVVIKKKKD